MDAIREQLLVDALNTLARYLTMSVTGDWSVDQIAEQLGGAVTAALYVDEELDPASAQGRLLAPRMRDLTGEHLHRFEQALGEARALTSGRSSDA